MTVSKILSSLICLLLCSLAWCQKFPPEELPSWKLKNLSYGYQRAGDIYSAIEMAEEFHSRRPRNKEMQKLLAELYIGSRDYTAALEMMDKFLDLEKNKDPEWHFKYALVLKQNGLYSRAEKCLEEFSAKYPKDKHPNYYPMVQNEKDGATWALEHRPNKNMLVVHIDQSLNQPHIDFSPLPLPDNKLLYSALKSNEVSFVPGEEPKRQFYLAQQIDTGKYRSLDMTYPFNDPSIDCVNGSFSADGKLFVFARCQRENPAAKPHCKLYESSLVEQRWTTPRLLAGQVNDETYTSTYPGLGYDLKGNTILYFASDREGGMGGMDLWYSVRDEKKKSFKAPKNCGKQINTGGHEIAPYYHSADKQLYFSSSGLPGMGGFDIYQTSGELKKWNEPKNLGAPINSEADDLQYIVKSDRESGYFVSNRKGGVALENATCCDDIYEFYTLKPVELIIKGTIAYDDSLGSTPKDSLTTIDLLLKADSSLIRVETIVVGDSNSFKLNIKPNNEYKIIASKPGFFKNSVDVDTRGKTKSENIDITTTLRPISNAPIVVKNIYYPFDKDYLTEGSVITIDTTILAIMTDNPEIIVEIGSHTDALGRDDYNQDLSQRRAQSVVNYLISKGIDPKRLVAKGYGESVPIAPNNNPDGSDNPEGRQKNRRTEFRIIGTIPGVSNIYYEE